MNSAMRKLVVLCWFLLAVKCVNIEANSVAVRSDRIVLNAAAAILNASNETAENDLEGSADDGEVTTTLSTATTEGLTELTTVAEAEPTEPNAEITTEAEIVETTTESATEPQNVTASIASTTASVAPACKAPGALLPHPIDCHLYYNCTNALESQQATCGPGKAFNRFLKRCVRDIATCNEGPRCVRAGSTAHPANNRTYTLCVRKLNGGYRKYIVTCAQGEIYQPLLGKCFIDFDNLHNLPPNYWQNDEIDVEREIKAELKEFKIAEKLRLKQEKLRRKQEKKLQKELAKKKAKEEEDERDEKEDKSKEENSSEE